MDAEEEATTENALSAPLANDKFEEFCQGKMARSEHEVEFRLDNTELRLRPKWIQRILLQTKVREVK